MREYTSLADVRAETDRVDRAIVALLAERSRYVAQVMRFKTTAADVAAPRRAERVIANVRDLAREQGADPDLAEQVYRAMIAWFIAYELAALTGGSTPA